MYKYLKLLLVVATAYGVMIGCGKNKGKKDNPAAQVDPKNVEGDEKNDPGLEPGKAPDSSDGSTEDPNPTPPADEPINPIIGTFQQADAQYVTLQINADLTIATNLVLSNPLGYGNVVTPQFPNALVAVDNQEGSYQTSGSYFDARGYSRNVVLQLQLQEEANNLRVYVELPNTDLNQYDCFDCCYPCIQPDPFPTSPGSSVRFDLVFTRIEAQVAQPSSK